MIILQLLLSSLWLVLHIWPLTVSSSLCLNTISAPFFDSNRASKSLVGKGQDLRESAQLLS